MRGDAGGILGSRLAALTETAVVTVLGFATLWLIPAHTTSGPVLGLPPAFLPTACTVAILTLAGLGLALRLWKPEPLGAERRAPYWPAALILGVVLAGMAALQLAGPLAGGLVVMILGRLTLGERRGRVLLVTAAGTAFVLGLVFRVWR